MIVDIESGSFVPPQRSEIDLYLDAHTKAPGVYLEEKLVSGAYLGEICRLALLKASREGLFSVTGAGSVEKLRNFSTPQADSFLTGQMPDLFTENEDISTAQLICKAVFARSAKHIACTLTAIMRYNGFKAGSRVLVSADGSVFRKSRHFRSALEAYVLEYATDWDVEYAEMENSTIIGTAIGALIN